MCERSTNDLNKRTLVRGNGGALQPQEARHKKKYYQTEKGKQKQRRRGIKERRDLTNAYVKALLKGKDHQLVVTDEMIVMKREQLILHRLTKELKQEIINQLENENGN